MSRSHAPLLLAALLAAPPAWADAGPVQDTNAKQAALPAAAKQAGKSVQAIVRTPQRRQVPEAQVAPVQPQPKWTGGGELGVASAHGNSTTESLNGRLNLRYADGLWAHSLEAFGLRASAEFARTGSDGSITHERRTTANRYTLGGNSAYLMDARGTINTALRLEHDDFGTYSQQQSLSLSYGNRVVDGDKAQLDLQIGPGYRRTHDRIDDETRAGAIARGRLGLKYALTPNAEIVNTLLIESGDYNTFAQNDLGVSVTMNSHLALKAGWQARHNSNVDEDRKKTDTLTTMNVVYKFK